MATQPRSKDDLLAIAHEAMLERGLLPDFSAAVIKETAEITRAAEASGDAFRDLRGLLWASIDNDDSRDLDQLSVAEPAGERRGEDPGGHCRRRCAGQQGLRDRRPRVDQHHLRLHAGRHLSHAAGEAVDRPHFARRGAGTPGDRDGNGDQRRRYRDGFRHLPGRRRQSRQACLQRGRRMARGHGGRAASACGGAGTG